MDEKSDKSAKQIIKYEDKKDRKKDKKESKSDDPLNHRPMTRSMGGFEVEEEKPAKKTEPIGSFEKELCLNLMNRLMKISESEIFMEPVDPEMWNIPNYFEIIKTPMDLGTVLKKIKKDLYFSLEDFGNDVRLTFTNAMTYNPPGNYVHSYAEKLIKIFDNYFRHCLREQREHLKEEKEQTKQKKKYSSKPLTKPETHYISKKLKNIPKECLGEVLEVLEIEKIDQQNGEVNIKLKDYPNSVLRHLHSIFRQNENDSNTPSVD